MTPKIPATEHVTELRVGDEQIELFVGQGEAPQAHVSLPLGPTRLVRDCLRHTPPRASDIEHAIDVIEDALAGVRGQPRGATLLTRDPALRFASGHFVMIALDPLGRPTPAPPLPPAIEQD